MLIRYDRQPHKSHLEFRHKRLEKHHLNFQNRLLQIRRLVERRKLVLFFFKKKKEEKLSHSFRYIYMIILNPPTSEKYSAPRDRSTGVS